MEQKRMFSMANFLMAAMESQKRVMVETSTDRIVFGKVQFVDFQGPFPSFQLYRENESPVVCAMSHLVTIQWDDNMDSFHKEVPFGG